MNIKNIVNLVTRRFMPENKMVVDERLRTQDITKLIKRCGPRRALWVLQYIETVLGGHKSFECRLPVDPSGNPLPWYTYPAIEYLQQLDFSQCDIFEYGSGNSSRFWSKLARSVISVESDPAWHKTGTESLAANQVLLLKTEVADYANSIHEKDQEFDIIIIDGMFRYNCTIEAVKRIKPGGFILFDNSDWFPNSCKLLKQNGFFQIDFIGAGPVNSCAWCTSIYLKGQPYIPRLADRDAPVVQAGLVLLSEHDRLLN